jgi:hypothetical protein
MSGKIYFLGEDSSLHPLEESGYEAEAVLQELLASHPDLLAGEQVNPSDPRRWLLVSRELAVGAEEGGPARWAIDHLFIDQEGIPTLVEVKRSTNSQIRREVVGQMLDYAANGAVYWTLEQLIAAHRRRCDRDGVDPASDLAEVLDEEQDQDEFWQRVKTNLRAGRIRLVFVADQIPSELRRIIEFLNEQMDSTEVLGLEVHQYLGEGNTVLVPRVVGFTAGAEQAKGVRRTKSWDRTSFLETLANNRTQEEAEAAARILDWCEARGLTVRWGSGLERGSFSPKLTRNGVTHNMMTVWNWAGEISIQFESMREPPFSEFERRREFADRLERVPGSRAFPDDQLKGSWPTLRIGSLIEAGGMDQFLETWDWFLGQIPS